MKRYPGMNVMRGVLFGLALVAAACGGERSVASKSAAAYDEAKVKGIEVTGGHEAGAATDTDHSAHGDAADMQASHDMSRGDMPMDHSAHGATADAHAGHDMNAGGMAMDHNAMGHDMSAGNAHAQHGGTSAASGGHAHDMSGTAAVQHATMQHGATATGSDAHAGHAQTTTGMAGMDHSQHGAVATPIAANAPRSNADIRSIQPPATLQPDAFDAPAPVSVNEAAKAGQSRGHEGHGMRGITPGEDRENPPTPMPATRDGSKTTVTPPAHDHHGGH